MRRRVLSDLDELDDYSQSWEELRVECQAPIFSSYDAIRIWLSVFKDHLTPEIVMVEDKGELVGLVPFCAYRHRAMGLPIRTLSLAGNGRKTEDGVTILGFSLLGAMARDHDPRIVSEIVKGMNEMRWNLMQVKSLEPSETARQLLANLRQEYGQQPFTVVHNMSYMFPQEGSVDAEFGWHNRREMRRVRQRLDKDGRLKTRVIEDPEGAEAAMSVYVKQHIERWSNKKGSIFRKKENAKLLSEMARVMAGQGRGVVYEVLIDGEVAGQSFALLDGQMVRGYRLGMNDKFAEFSPGKLAMLTGMDDARRRGFKGWDMLGGRDEYKYHMMTGERDLGSFMTQRGSLAFLSRLRDLPPVRSMDERLRIRERLLKRVYRY